MVWDKRKAGHTAQHIGKKKKKMVFCLGSSCCTITRLPWYICSLKGLERAVDMDDTVSRIRLSSPGHCWWRSCNSWGRRAIQAGALLSRKAVTLCGWERSSNNKKKKRKKSRWTAGRGPISASLFLFSKIRVLLFCEGDPLMPLVD